MANKKYLQTKLCPNCLKAMLVRTEPTMARCENCHWKGTLKATLHWAKK